MDGGRMNTRMGLSVRFASRQTFLPPPNTTQGNIPAMGDSSGSSDNSKDCLYVLLTGANRYVPHHEDPETLLTLRLAADSASPSASGSSTNSSQPRLRPYLSTSSSPLAMRQQVTTPSTSWGSAFAVDQGTLGLTSANMSSSPPSKSTLHPSVRCWRYRRSC